MQRLKHDKRELIAKVVVLETSIIDKDKELEYLRDTLKVVISRLNVQEELMKNVNMLLKNQKSDLENHQLIQGNVVSSLDA